MRKAKRKGQRVLAAALCVGMLASMVPAQAFANDEPITAIVQQEDTPADPDAPTEDTDAGQTYGDACAYDSSHGHPGPDSQAHRNPRPHGRTCQDRGHQGGTDRRQHLPGAAG